MINLNKPIQTDEDIDSLRGKMRIKANTSLCLAFLCFIAIGWLEMGVSFMVVEILSLIISFIAFVFFAGAFTSTNPISGPQAIRLESLVLDAEEGGDVARNYIAKIISIRKLRSLDYTAVKLWHGDKPKREGEAAMRRLNAIK